MTVTIYVTMTTVTLSCLLFLTLTLPIMTDAQQNPFVQCNGEVGRGGICYTFRPTITTHDDALQRCRASDSILAAIHTQTIQDMIDAFLKRIDFDEVWIGLSSLSKRWIWVSDELSLLSQGCYSYHPDLSEFSTEVIPRITDLTAEKCITACLQLNFIYAALLGGTRCLCGNSYGRTNVSRECVIPCPGNVTNSVSGYCGGQNETSVFFVYGTYGQFGYSQPNNFDGRQDCGVLDTWVGGKMADEPCHKNLSFICDLGRSSSNCNGQFDRAISGRCYYVRDDMMVTWDEARATCEQIGAMLVEVRSAERQREFISYLTANYPTPQNRAQFWIGLRRGTWSWLTGDPYIFTEWAPNFPSPDEDRRCALMIRRTIAGQDKYVWEDRSCQESHYFLCQKDLIPDESTTTKSTSTTSEISSTASETTSAPSATSLSVSSSSAVSQTSPILSSTSQTTTSRETTSPPTTSPPTTFLPTTPPQTTSSATEQAISSEKESPPTTVTESPTISSTSQTKESVTSDAQTSTTPDVFVPTAQQSTQEEISDFEIVLIVLGILLALLIVICLIIWCCVKPQRETRKVDYEKKTFDARPIAPIPNSGDNIEYDKFASTLNLNST